MIRRRDLVIGAACLAASGAAYALQPRRHVSLLGADKIDRIIPTTVGDWSSRRVDDLVAPDPDDGSDELYDELVERIYQQASTGDEIMMLMAHGQSQTTHLQLHRPEDCYPAFGFAVSDRRPTELPLASGVGLPAVSLVAEAPGRREHILYWSRLGEFLPTSGGEERVDRLKTSVGGYIPDGLLARFSVVGTDGEGALSTMNGFIPQLVRAVSANRRGALIGTQRANALIQAKV